MKLDTPDVIESLGDVMQRLMACSTCYAEYLANAPNVTPTLRKVNKKSSFVAFTERVKSKNSAVGRIGLEELLIVPVQRMPRYQLLIEQILKYVPASSRPRARLQFVSQMARTIALRETDAETKQAAIRWTVNRHVHGLPPDLLSSNHPLMNFVDVDDFPLALEGPQGAEQETLAVTLLLFDDLMLIIQRSPGTSGTEALGLTNLNSLADLMQASAPGANASIAEQCISTPGLLQNVDAAQLVYKGHVGLMDLEARDLGGPDFQVRHTDKGVQSGATVLSARWSHRPVRQYAVVEPPPPATKLSGTAAPAKSPARVQKTNFLESLWRAQARKLSSSSQSVRRQVSPATFDPVTGAVIRPRQINYFLIHDRATWELDVRKTPVLLRVNIANTHSRLHLPDPSMPSSGPYAVVEITAIDQQCRCWVQTQFSFEPQVEDKLIPLGMLTDYLPSVIERLPPSFRTSFVTPRVRLDALDQLARLTPPPRTSPQTTRSPGSSPTGSSNSPGRLRDVGRHLLSAATGMGTLRRSAGPGSEPGANDFASLGNGRTRSRALSSTGGTASSGAFGSVSTSNWGSSTTASDHTHGTLATTMSAASSASSPSSHKRGQSKRAFHLLGRTRTGPRVESEEFPSPRVDPASLAPPKSFEKDVEERTQDSATPTPTPTPCPSYGKTTEPELKQASAPAESTTLAGQSMLSDGDAGHDESRQLPARSSTLLPRAQRLIEQQESQRPRPARSTRLRAHPPAPVPLGPLQVSNATNSTSKRVASDRINDNAKEDNLDERPTKRVSVHSSHSKRSDGGRSSFQSGRSNEASKASEGRPEQDRRVRRALYKASKRPRAFADMRNYLNDVRRHYGQEAPDAQFLCGVLSQLEDWFHDAEADSLADKEELETIVTSVQTPASSSARDTGRLEMENARLASELAELKNQCRDRLVELEDFSQRESSWEADRAYLHERLGEIENRNLHLQSQINDLTAELEVAHAATYGSEALQAQNAELITAVKRLKAANHDLKQRCEHAIRQAQAAAELDEDLAAVRARNVELQAQCRQLEHAQRDTLAANAEIHAAFNEELDNMWRDATIKTDNEQIQSLRLSLQDALAERNRLLADLQYVHQLSIPQLILPTYPIFHLRIAMLTRRFRRVLRNHPTELELGF